MRKVLILCIFIFVVLCALPAFTAIVSEESSWNTRETSGKANTNKETDNSLPDSELVISEALRLADDGFCNDGLKAVLAIAENNIKYYSENKLDTDITRADKSDRLYIKLEKLYKETDSDISYQKHCVFIPTASLSCGYTKTNENYPYIRPVASPWDCENKSYIYGTEYPVGISIGGIDYLCKEGMSFKEALKWYLPGFDIK